ncbi:MAG: hypothetical protein IJK18_03925 [Clostridia bacterium]|nr:hypothetical protein [Clostridia bacterium]
MQEQKEEKIIDIKGTIKQLVETDEPEISQEEAIMKYGEPKKKKNNNGGDDDEDVTEELEHLRRIKKELLASLKRVEKLEEQLFKDREEKLKLNVKASKNGGFSNSKQIEQKETETEKQNQKERE